MSKRKIILGVVMSCLIFCIGLGLNINKKTAQALTPAQIKTKVANLNKEVKKLEGQRKQALAIEKKQKKGTTPVFGYVVSYNPFIMKDGLNLSYYWINNSKNMSVAINIATGDIKFTGKYRNYDGITCAVANAAKVSNKSYKLERKIENKNKAIKAYKNSLKEKVVFNKSNEKVTIGTPKKLSWKWKYSGKYNSLEWKSSDPSIATVNGSGKVTGKRQGTVTISVTTSLSKKASECQVTIGNGDLRVYYCPDDYYSDDIEIKDGSTIAFDSLGDECSLDCEFDSKTIKADKYESSDNSVAKVNRDYLEIVGVGTATITITYRDVSVSFLVVVDATMTIQYFYDYNKDWYGTIEENSTISMNVGGGFFIYITMTTPDDYVDVTCESSDDSVVEVTPRFGSYDDFGYIEAVGVGSATITLTCCNKSVSFTVVVGENSGSNDYNDDNDDDHYYNESESDWDDWDDDDWDY